MTEAFLWGLAGASSLVLGAVIVFIHSPGRRVLGAIMGFGSGVLISAVSFELVEEATTIAGASGATAFGLVAGAVVFTIGDIGLDKIGGRDHRKIGVAAASASGMTIVLGTVLDGVPESAVLGLTLLQTGTIGVSMLVAVFISNLPESISASDGLLSGGWSKGRVLILWSLVAVASGVASALGYALLDGAAPELVAFVLAFAGGAILMMLATSMMPEAFEHAGRTAGLTTVFGFITAYAIDWLTV